MKRIRCRPGYLANPMHDPEDLYHEEEDLEVCDGQVRCQRCGAVLEGER